jgi:hypothetical protein
MDISESEEWVAELRRLRRVEKVAGIEQRKGAVDALTRSPIVVESRDNTTDMGRVEQGKAKEMMEQNGLERQEEEALEKKIWAELGKGKEVMERNEPDRQEEEALEELTEDLSLCTQHRRELSNRTRGLRNKQ